MSDTFRIHFFTNEKILHIFTLAPKKWSNQKDKGTFLYSYMAFFPFSHSLSARAEICQIFSLVEKFILKLSDL